MIISVRIKRRQRRNRRRCILESPRQREKEGYLSLTARTDDSIVGYIGIKAVLDEADITNVAVHPQWRRRGIGQMLLTDLLGKAAGRNVKRIFLEVRVSNEAALALYSQAGFQIIDKRKNYYEKPKEDAYIMVWDKL